MLTAPNDTPPNDDLAPPAREERVSILTGERACAACAFNLSGQPVVREPHYRLLIVRCPECGAVAPLQEYPALGPWARRWGAIAAAFYVLVLIAGSFAVGGIGYGLSIGALESPSRELAVAIATRQREDAAKSGATAGIAPTGQRSTQPSAWDSINHVWLAKQNETELRRLAGPWSELVPPASVPVWIGEAFVLALAGVVGAVALPGVRGVRFILPAAAPTVLAAFFCWQNYLGFRSGSNLSANELAESLLAPGVWAVSLATMFVSLLAGMLVGRPLARFALRLLLPPRLRNALGIVWTADGLTPNPSRRAASAPRA